MPADIPVISSITPTSGPLAGGTAVTISGREFVYVTDVRFGTTAATSYTVSSASQIIATSPAGSAGTVNITVGNTKGTSATSAADQFTYSSGSSGSCDVPVISYLIGGSGPTGGGTTVEIHGSHLDCGTATVKFGTVTAASVTVNSDTQITVVSPAAGSAGTVDITVTNTGGTSATKLADQFTYV